jgi:hypothetical protein
VILLHFFPVGLATEELKGKVKDINDVIEEMMPIRIEKSVLIITINIFSNLKLISL